MNIDFVWTFCRLIWRLYRFLALFGRVRKRLSSSQKRDKNSRDRNNFMQTRTLCHSASHINANQLAVCVCMSEAIMTHSCVPCTALRESESLFYFRSVFVCANSYWLTVAGEIAFVAFKNANTFYLLLSISLFGKAFYSL